MKVNAFLEQGPTRLHVLEHFECQKRESMFAHGFPSHDRQSRRIGELMVRHNKSTRYLVARKIQDESCSSGEANCSESAPWKTVTNRSEFEEFCHPAGMRLNRCDARIEKRVQPDTRIEKAFHMMPSDSCNLTLSRHHSP